MLLHKNLKAKDDMQKLFEEAKEVLNSDKKLFIAFIDGNCMKAVNDTYGHLAGDNTIARLSHIICRHTGSNGNVIKFGGDEFVVILSNFSQSDVKAFANRLQLLVKNDDYLKENIGGMSVSIGVAEYCPKRHENFSEVLAESDTLMYVAKTDLQAHTAFSFDNIKVEQGDRRRENLIHDMMREYFRSINKMVKIQHPEFNDRILIEATRNIWRINGKRVIMMGTPSETMTKVIGEYKMLKTRMERKLSKKSS